MSNFSIKELAVGEAVKENNLLTGGPPDQLTQRSIDWTRGRLSAYCLVLSLFVGGDAEAIERKIRAEAEEIVSDQRTEGGEEV